MANRSARALIGLALAVFGVAAQPAAASNHLIKVKAIYPGSGAQPLSQFIELQMFADGENLVSGRTARSSTPPAAS